MDSVVAEEMHRRGVLHRIEAVMRRWMLQAALLRAVCDENEKRRERFSLAVDYTPKEEPTN